MPAPDYRVLVDIQRFDSVPGEAVTVEAIWSVRAAAGAPRSGHSLVREPVGVSLDDIVAGQSRALTVLSADIAAAVTAR